MPLPTVKARWKRRARAFLGLSTFLAAGAARAEGPSLEDGFPVGRWLLAPSLTAGWSSDSNVFYRSSNNAPQGDNVLRVVPEIHGKLPFRNSELDLGYRRTFVDYRKTPLDGSGFHEFEGALRLRFSTHDVLEVTGAHTRGRAEFLAFDAGEIVFQGEPYRLNQWSAGLSREVLGHRGYAVRVQRSDLNFSQDVEVQFFDFRSLSLDAEYREPLGPHVWLLTSLQIEDADHYCRTTTSEGEPCPAVGVPFRRERSGVVKLGIRGARGGQEPFFLRLGRDVRQYRPGPAARGELVGDGLLTLRLGPAVRLFVTGNRTVWPSFFAENDSYLAQEVEIRAERQGNTRRNWGAKLGLQGVSYPEPDSSGNRRQDRRVRAEAYATFLARDKAGLRLSVARHRRTSNLEGYDYEGTVFFAGIVLGWF